MHNPKAVKYYQQGTILQQKGKLPKSERAYRRAIKTHPDFVEALNNLGNVLRALGRIREAVTCYRRSLESIRSLQISITTSVAS